MSRKSRLDLTHLLGRADTGQCHAEPPPQPASPFSCPAFRFQSAPSAPRLRQPTGLGRGLELDGECPRPDCPLGIRLLCRSQRPKKIASPALPREPVPGACPPCLCSQDPSFGPGAPWDRRQSAPRPACLELAAGKQEPAGSFQRSPAAKSAQLSDGGSGPPRLKPGPCPLQTPGSVEPGHRRAFEHAVEPVETNGGVHRQPQGRPAACLRAPIPCQPYRRLGIASGHGFGQQGVGPGPVAGLAQGSGTTQLSALCEISRWVGGDQPLPALGPRLAGFEPIEPEFVPQPLLPRCRRSRLENAHRIFRCTLELRRGPNELVALWLRRRRTPTTNGGHEGRRDHSDAHASQDHIPRVSGSPSPRIRTSSSSK